MDYLQVLIGTIKKVCSARAGHYFSDPSDLDRLIRKEAQREPNHEQVGHSLVALFSDVMHRAQNRGTIVFLDDGPTPGTKETKALCLQSVHVLRRLSIESRK